MLKPFDIELLHDRARRFVPVQEWWLPVTVAEYAYLIERNVLSYEPTKRGGKRPKLWTWNVVISPTYDLFDWAVARAQRESA